MKQYISVEDPLSMHKTGWNETALISEIPSNFNNEIAIIALGLGKKPVSVLSIEFCEEQAFPYLLPKGKFGDKSLWDIPVSPAWYFNQSLLNFNKYFQSDANDILQWWLVIKWCYSAQLLCTKFIHLKLIHLDCWIYWSY